MSGIPAKPADFPPYGRVSDQLFTSAKVLIALYFAAQVLSYTVQGRSFLSGYWDEVFILVIFLLSAVYSGKNNPPTLKYATAGLFGLVSFGLLGHVYSALLGESYNFQAAFRAIAVEAKLFIGIIGLSLLAGTGRMRPFEDYYLVFAKIFIVFGTGLLLLQFADAISGGVDIHGRSLLYSGRNVLHGFYDHKFKSSFVNVVSICVVLSFLVRGAQWRPALILLGCLHFFALIYMQSVKEVVAVAIVGLLFLNMYFRLLKMVPVYLLALPLLIYFVTDAQIFETLLYRFQLFTGQFGFSTVREALYAGSIQIGADRFPFGLGAGSFGSSASRDVWFSDAYYDLGIVYLHGGSPTDGIFLIDTFWPKIVGEYGFVFGLFYVALVTYPALISYRYLMQGAREPGLVFSTFSLIALFVIAIATPAYNYEDAALIAAFAIVFPFYWRLRIARPD